MLQRSILDDGIRIYCEVINFIEAIYAVIGYNNIVDTDFDSNDVLDIA